MNCKYSVIIPVYNKEKHIARAVRSVLTQSCNELELIIVDDASDDNSLNIAKSFEDPRIKIIESDSGPGHPGGAGRARNTGVKAATGDWVCFLDADDEWESDYLKTISGLRDKFSEAVILSTGWRIVHADGRIEENRYHIENKKTGDHIYNKKDFLKAGIKSMIPVCSSSVTVQKDVLLRAGGFPEKGARSGEDNDTWLRVVMTGGYGAVAGCCRAVYFRNAENMVSKSAPPAIWNNHRIKSIKMFLKTEKNDEIRTLLKAYRKHIRKSFFKRWIDFWIIRIFILIWGEAEGQSRLRKLTAIKRKI